MSISSFISLTFSMIFWFYNLIFFLSYSFELSNENSVVVVSTMHLLDIFALFFCEDLME